MPFPLGTWGWYTRSGDFDLERESSRSFLYEVKLNFLLKKPLKLEKAGSVDDGEKFLKFMDVFDHH